MESSAFVDLKIQEGDCRLVVTHSKGDGRHHCIQMFQERLEFCVGARPKHEDIIKKT